MLRPTIALLAATTALAQSPYVNLRAPKSSPTQYRGDTRLAAVLRGGLARPLALASADFDGDGVPDLVSGFAEPGGGIVSLHRGNIDSLWPYGPALRNGDPPPFLPDARVFALPEAPDFLAAGDFDADGHTDLIAAHRGSAALWFLPGDGHGNFGAPRKLALPAGVTALLSGEVNRRDGLADIVVAVANEDGASVLVFESPRGAFYADPEVFPLRAPASALQLSPLDRPGFHDLMIASGHELVIVRGRDRKLTLEQSEQAKVADAEIARQTFPFALRSIAAGSFSSRAAELAVLGDDSRIHLLSHVSRFTTTGETHIDAVPGGPPVAAGARKTMRRDVPQEAEWTESSVIDAPPGDTILAAHVSAAGAGDLLVLDSAGSRVHVLSPAPRNSGRHGLEPAASLAVDGASAAVLPMRLNQHPLHSLVMLTTRTSAPVTSLSNPANTFTVTNTNDSGAGSLRQAIIDANSATGSSTIAFNIPTSDPKYNPVTGAFVIQPLAEQPGNPCPAGSIALPTIDANSITIDGYTQPGSSPNTAQIGDNAVIKIQIDGSLDTTPGGMGLDIVGDPNAGFVFRGMSFTNWNHHCQYFDAAGITLFGATGGFVEGNFSGLDATGIFLAGNLWGVYDSSGEDFTLTTDEGGPTGQITSPGNIIGGTTPQARNIFSGNSGAGIADDCTAFHESTQGNYIGLDRTGSGVFILGNTGVTVCGNSDIGGTAAGAGNLISGNLYGNVYSFGTGLVQGNLIGTDATGTLAEPALQNAFGVWLNASGSSTATGSTIGGTSPAARNIISGNPSGGVTLTDGVYDNLVQGNYIGLDISGAKALGNLGDGVSLGVPVTGFTQPVPQGAVSNNPIGGATPGAGNVISGNSGHGIEIQGLLNDGNETPAHTIQGNFIGTDPSGAMAIANAGAGISLGAGTYSTTIGGTDIAPRNVIAFNGLDGVTIDPGSSPSTDQNDVVIGNAIFSNRGAGVRVNSGTQQTISRNSIYSNSKLGIDIGNGNPNINSSCQSNTNGPNNLQNAPVLTAGSGSTFLSATATDPNGNTSDFSNCVAVSGTAFTAQGSFNGKPNTSFTIEFFRNDSCDPSGFGQGKTYIGSTKVTSDGSCNATINQPIDLTQADLSITLSQPQGAFLGLPTQPTPTLQSVVINLGAAAAHNVTVTTTLPSTLSLQSATTTAGSCSVNGNNLSCSLGTMPAGATATLVVQFNALTADPANVTLAAAATETDPNPANNSATVTVAPQYLLPTIDHFDPPTVVAGSPDLSLNIIGRNFVPGVTTATFNGSPVQITAVTQLSTRGLNFSDTGCAHVNGAFPSETTPLYYCAQITILVPASQLTTPGTPTITLTNPAPGGGTFSSLSMGANKRFTILAGSCTYTVSPNTPQSVAAKGAVLSFTVTDNPTTCTWNISSPNSWILPQTPGDFQGNNGANFTDIMPNPGAPRSGILNIAGQAIVINQDGNLPCSLAWNQISETFLARGGSGQVALLETPTSCSSWTATSDSPWLTIVSGGDSGPYNHSGILQYTVAANSGTARTGHLSVPGAGNFTVIQGGTPPATLTANSGTPQSAAVGSGFATPLQVLYKDSNGNPQAGVTITFTPPASGASATLSNPTAVTNASGLASVTATANGVTGTYTVSAGANGATTQFFLTNTAGPPASVTATGGTPQTTSISTAFGAALQATVKDAFGNPVPGVTVNFTAPTSGAGATLSSGTATTNASGVASVTATANATAGAYNVSASVGGFSANFSLTNTAQTTVSITIQTAPAGLAFTLDGTSYTAPRTFSLAAGTSHAVSVAATIAGSTGTQLAFSNWSDSGGPAHNITVPNTAATYTANFTTQYQLTTSALPATLGSVSPVSGSFFNAGSTVNVTAVPGPGVTFVNWTGPVGNSNAITTTVVMSGPVSITANFAAPKSGVPVFTPSQVAILYPVGTDPAAAAATLVVTDDTAARFTVTANVPWLSIATTGVLPGKVILTPVPNGLAAGPYAGFLTFKFDDGGVASVQVQLRVANVQFRPQPASLTFTAQPGSTTSQSQTVGVGAFELNFAFQAAVTTSAGGNWLSVDQTSATTPATLTVTVNPSGLAPGTYSGALVLSAAIAVNSPDAIPVTLSIPTPPPPPPSIAITSIVNAASGAAGPAAPNTILTAFGTFPGCTAAQAQVDGTPSDVFYSSATQVNFLMPARVAGETSAAVSITCGGLTGKTTAVALAPVDPAIFTVSMNGAGEASVVNQDGSIGGASADGTYIEVFVTGFGLYGTPSADGLSRLALPVSATVDGLPATVQYAGQAPNFTAGLQQVNLLIPPGVPAGSAVPLQLTVNGVTTQAGVTILPK